ncbi:MAG TPA: hypothetical protein VHE82_01460 [Gemmatimonadaceae bacterium]|nr:hypothetical protein [Gemmatimonadaceae bacterium]
MPSIHERETFSERYIPGGTSRETASAIAPNAEAVFAELHHATLALQLAIPEAELCERVRRAVEDAAARDAGSMKELRLAVRSFTVALRDIGTTPERVLIALKTVINNRTLVAIAPHASDWNGDELREKISTWCIEEFFRKKTA